MKIVIIGGVAAGMSAAAKAKRVAKDAQITVYEKTDIVSFGACGLPYFVGDFFDNPNMMIAREADKFRETGIEVKTRHEVISVDPKSKVITVRNLESEEIFKDNYDKLMIATGASAIIPPIENIELDNVFTLKSMKDGKNLKKAALKSENKNVIVIGAGYIGIETVEAMKNLGKEVRLIQLDSRVLPDSFDREITDLMEKELVEQGVSLHLSEAVKAFKGTGKIKQVVTDSGVYPADIVVIATGVKPNTEFLAGTGITMKKGAIIIDEYGKTNIEDIYAAGDCATVYHMVKEENVYIPLATTANKIGRIVGENLGGLNNKFPGTLGSACVKVMELEAGRTGISEADAIEKGINYKTVFISDKNQTGYYPGQESIHVKLIYNSSTKVILGGQIIGKKGAVLRVDVLAAAIYNKMTTEQLGMLDLCYAPPFARTWDVLNVVGNVAK